MRYLMMWLAMWPGCEFVVRIHPTPAATEQQNATKPQTRKVLKQVRPWRDLGGGVDDGLEWVEEPIQ